MPTWENYDEDEYFLRFHRIHPILIYSENEFDKQKLNLQDKLLIALQNKKISMDDFTKKYKKISKMCINKKIKKDTTEYEYKQLMKTKLEEIEIQENKNIMNEFEAILSNIN